MTIDLIIEIYREMLRTAALVAAPILGVAMAIGLTISLIQTVTNIQEQTLTFVPKILGIAITIGIGLPWILGHLMSFLAFVISQVPGLVLAK